MGHGVISSNKFDSKLQLEKLSRGEKVLQVDPQIKLVKALPVIYHIAQQAKSHNYYDIVIGSFIRDASGGKCTGHCEGRCIDINYKQGSFESKGAAQMVINILTYLVTLPSAYRKSLGFGMPMQGEFFGKGLTKFNSVDASLLRNQQLASLVRQNGAYVFPDNDNHLHIQVNWTV
jgi:hypothetical protein